MRECAISTGKDVAPTASQRAPAPQRRDGARTAWWSSRSAEVVGVAGYVSSAEALRRLDADLPCDQRRPGEVADRRMDQSGEVDAGLQRGFERLPDLALRSGLRERGVALAEHMDHRAFSDEDVGQFRPLVDEIRAIEMAMAPLRPRAPPGLEAS